jgi:hypothetical protein
MTRKENRLSADAMREPSEGACGRERQPRRDACPTLGLGVGWVRSHWLAWPARRLYQHHAAIEDMVVFPAWKRTLTPARYGELSEQFEALEKRMFGHDGF